MKRLRDVDGLDALMDLFESSTSERFNFREALAYRLLGRDKVDGVLISLESASKFAEHSKLYDALLQQPFVKELVFDGIALGLGGSISHIMWSLERIPLTSNIESLSFVGCNIGKSGLLSIAKAMESPKLHRIKRLDLSNNPMGGTGDLETLAVALQTGHTAYLELNLSNVGLNSVADRAAIGAILHTRNIVRLNLSNNKLNQQVCLHILSQLNATRDLREIDLTGNDGISAGVLDILAGKLQYNTTITKLRLPNVCNADGVLIETLPSTTDEVSLMQAAQKAIGKIIQRNLVLALKPATEKHKGSDTCSDALVKPIDAAMMLHDDRRVITSSAEPILLSDSAHGLRRRGDSQSAGLLEHAPLEEAAVKSGNALMNCWHAVVERCCPRRRAPAR